VFVFVKNALNVFATFRSANFHERNVLIPVENVDVDVRVGTVAPSTAITPADTREMVVSVVCPTSSEPTPSASVVESTTPARGRPVQFVSVPEDGVPRVGVVSVGLARVLLVSVSVPASVAKSPSDNAELNCATVPLTVLELRLTVLFVSVSVEEIVGTFTVPLLILPVPFGLIFKSTFASHPVASIMGQLPVAALEIVSSFTADATEVTGNLMSSFKFPSPLSR